MEEAQPVNSYINARGEAIEAIERTINELGGKLLDASTLLRARAYMQNRYLRSISVSRFRTGRNGPAHRCQHGGRGGQCAGRTEGADEILVEGVREQVVNCEDVWGADGKDIDFSSFCLPFCDLLL